MKKFFYSFIFLLIIFFTPSSIFAQEKINSFDVRITANKDGLMTISESIMYDFGEDPRHGIFRTIPLVSKVGDLYRIIDIKFTEIKRDGRDELFSVNRGRLESEVKIGDSEKTITGVHNYIIIYTVKNGIGSNFDDYDEIYWNVTGNEWGVPIEKASLEIKTDFNVNTLESVCFTGPANSKLQNCSTDNNLISTTEGLQAYEGLTTVTKFPLNTFPKSVLQKSEPNFDPDLINFFKIYLPIMFLLNFILAPYLLFWYFKNKSKTRFGKPVVNFDIPKNISPVEAGIIDNHKLDQNDVVAAIFNLAIKKYLKIEEDKEKRTLMPDKIDYKLIKLKDEEGLDGFEKILLQKLFENGKSLKLKELKTDFYLTFSKLETESFKSLVLKKLYIKNPKNQIAGLIVAGIFSIVSANFILGLVLIYLSRKLNGRTSLGDKVDYEVDGLKIFLKAVSRYHKFQSKNLITVEKYIPYAIALGLQNEFMEELKLINPDYKPNWYSGSNNFMRIYPGMYAGFNSGITTRAPSSSSGFSSGSSGGGGGGGGGGSW